MNKYIVVFLLSIITLNAQCDDKTNSWWEISDYNAVEGAAGDFVIAGCTGMTCQRGTSSSRYAIVGMIAEKIVEHGGYFCPYQFQFNVYSKRCRGAGIGLLLPDTASEQWRSSCAWLCEAGYGGTNCMPQSEPVYCDNKPFTKQQNGRLATVNVNNNNVGKVSGIQIFAAGRHSIIVLGAIRFLEHGIVAAPVKVEGNRNVWCGPITYIEKVVQIKGATKILCANGYTPDQANSDCVPINKDMCTTQNMKMCPNFAKSGYDGSVHYLVEENGCAKFFCSDTSKAFPSVGTYSCEECAPATKSGVNTANGVCVKCKTGQYLEPETATCKNAKAFSKNDMLYGKGRTKSSSGLKQQCWTLATPEEYIKCINKE